MSATESFWDFSLRVYGDAEVQAACLRLQEHHGADVNVLLFCCWSAAVRGRLGAAERGAALELSRLWSGRVVQPLRGVRRWMKSDGCPDPRIDGEQCRRLREQIKRAELAAEKIQQQALEALNTGFAPAAREEAPLDAALANLRGYFEAAQVMLDEQAKRDSATIVAASFEQASVDAVLRELGA